MNDLFSAAFERHARTGVAPLAERMRPQTLDEYVGQDKILGPGKLLRQLIEEQKNHAEGALPSMIFWGPPGTGKTTLARLIARSADAEFVEFSAVSGGVKDARAIIEAARDRLTMQGRRTLLFVDEIHRFNKSQQDTFLPAVENGTLTLLGATTENPSFELNNALLSRARVVILEALGAEAIEKLIDRALATGGRGLAGMNVVISPEARAFLASMSGGDARSALNTLELATLATAPNADGQRVLDTDRLKEALNRTHILYDRAGEEHYNLISALHKAIRNSNSDAALYYLARMIEGGEDPIFIARRMVRAASEDIGLADPQALTQALAAKEAAELMGFPECDCALAQAAVYLACAPKSNSLYNAIKAARAEVQTSGPLPVPLHYRNAPTTLMKDIGYGKSYEYDHDWPDRISPQESMPDALVGKTFYEPGSLGFEKDLAKRLEYFASVRKKLTSRA